jgi:hypothetical protein
MQSQTDLSKNPVMIQIKAAENLRAKIKKARRFKTSKFYLIDKNEETAITRDELKLIDALLKSYGEKVLLAILIQTL